MVDEDLIELFNSSRDCLIELVKPTLDVYLTSMWDPINRHLILRDTEKILYKELSYQFPDMPTEYFPKLLFNVDAEQELVEFSLQNYLNTNTALNYLGTCEYDQVTYDMYYSPRWDIDPWVISRYGNLEENYISGSSSARSEYNLGIMTPLAIAYSMAVDLGRIKE